MCDCVNVDFGSYDNQIMVPMPFWMVGRDGDRIRQFVCIDRCIYEEVLELWVHGITTTGCCCGHNKIKGFIGVRFWDIERMIKLGYERIVHPEGSTLDKDSFYVKSVQPVCET